MEAKTHIKNGVLFGIGYMIGKHNLPTIPKKQREKIADDFADDVLKQTSKINDSYNKKLLIDFKSYWKKSSHQNIDDAIKGFLNK